MIVRGISEILQGFHLHGWVNSLISEVVNRNVPRIVPHVLRVLPHDNEAFTQGLAYNNGFLYESTGLYGSSSLRKFRAKDGSLLGIHRLGNDLFAEGIAILGGLLYQLTWKSQKAIVYDPEELRPVTEIRYHGEGWGLSATPNRLIMSNGSSLLTFRNQDFRIEQTLRVTSNHMPVRKLNDLEWVADRIYANLYHSEDILEVDCQTGRLTRIVDCSSLASQEGVRDGAHVLNGIAYNSDQKTFFVTGKCWNNLFEIQI